jgi:hypothetical protein
MNASPEVSGGSAGPPVKKLRVQVFSFDRFQERALKMISTHIPQAPGEVLVLTNNDKRR